MSQPINLEAERARFAFDVAEKGNKKQGDDFNYSAAVQELPSMLRMNGLRATMAYYFSKEKAHGHIFKDLEKWFREDDPTKMISEKLLPAGSDDKAKAKKFMETLIKLDDGEYRIVQAETLTLANWMIRFAKAPEENSSPKIENHAAGQS